MESNSNDKKEYILDLSVLMPGDIILEHGYKFHSYVIMEVTDSYYSHAMLYVDSTIIEATNSGGVFSKGPNRFAVANKNDLKVLRLSGGLHPDKAHHISMTARTLMGSSYNKSQAITSGKKIKPSNLKSKGQFCSRLVAQCYNSASIELVSNVDYCTPGDLERSDLLVEVNGAVKKASPQELSHALERSIIEDHKKDYVKWISKAKSILNKSNVDVETENDITNAIIKLKNKKIDKAILKAVERTNYLTFYMRDKDVNSYRYDSTEFDKKVGSNLLMIDGEISKEGSIVDIQSVNFKAYCDFYSKYPSCFLEAMRKLYYGILMITRERLIVIIAHCNKNRLSPSLLHHAKEMLIYIDYLCSSNT